MKILRKIKRYLKIYALLSLFQIKSELSYRTQFLVTAIAGPAYIASIFAIVLAAITTAPELGGINQQDAISLFILFNTSYLVGVVLYFQSLRSLLYDGFRRGVIDGYMLKPINVQFLATFSMFDVRNIPLLLFMLGALAWRVIMISPDLLELSLFLIYWILGIGISYFFASSFAVSGFYATKAAQVIELFDKTTDFGVYSPSIFPQSLGLLMTYVVPLLFMGWVPFQFLRGEGTVVLAITPVLVLGVSIIINQWLWKKGLQSYSSASS